MPGACPRRCTRSPRRGFGLIEVVIAMAIVCLMTLPVISLVSSTARSTASFSQRLVLELRARRGQAEVSSTTFEAATGLQGVPFPISLVDPDEVQGYRGYLRGIEEETRVRKLEPGLAEVKSTIVHEDGGRGRRKRLVVSRLKCDPTLSIHQVFPMNPEVAQ